MDIDNAIKEKMLVAQKNEITEYRIYKNLAKTVRNADNKKILENIAEDEFHHAQMWKKYTGKEVKPDTLKMLKYSMISRILGLTFGLKLMERREKNTYEVYYNLGIGTEEEIHEIIREEKEHENEVLAMLDEDFLQYTSSMVLGLNDALVELTGALAGFTLALKSTRLIALVGLVTGIAASLSMMSSEYLSTKAEGNKKSPLKASLYTGIAYLLTVLMLIFPYLIIANYFVCLAITISVAVFIIFLYNYYISITKDLLFKKQFMEMTGISLSVTTVTFFIGHLLRYFLGAGIS
ncbi:MAG: VIT1/CCC1 transporter family protein [Candidatus Brocadiaceae bacterium]|nr:VIT1/CCC1 transporter family protein [Candidatus Brocadiaceae bacterium]